MKNWTTKEIQYLNKNALLAETNQVLNIKEMAKKLDRTVQSVRTKIYSMQRSGELPAIDRTMQRDANNRPYSSEDDRRIIKMIKQGATYREIGEVLERDTASVSGRVCRLRKSGRLKSKRKKQWTEKETQILIDRVLFDETGHVKNYEELMKLVSKNYYQLTAKVTKLRKDGKISTRCQPGTTSTKSKQAMDAFNDARFAHVPKNKEEKQVDQQEQKNFMDTKTLSVSVDSREITLIQTTTEINGRKLLQYFTKDGQLLAQKELTSVAAEVSQ